MPGLYYQEQSPTIKNGHGNTVCNCKSCPCRSFDKKRIPGSKNVIPPNAVEFQLPRYKEPRSDTYSHTVYKKEFCSRYLMKQHATLAQKRASQRSKPPQVFEQDRFVCKTIADTDFSRYCPKEAALCKAKFPRTKRKEEFFYRPGEYSCNVKYPQQSLSHEDYYPKQSISTCKKSIRPCDMPPFEGISSYDRDFRAPPREAYAVNRMGRKRTIFN